jgi:hypothetical protein
MVSRRESGMEVSYRSSLRNSRQRSAQQPRATTEECQATVSQQLSSVVSRLRGSIAKNHATIYNHPAVKSNQGRMNVQLSNGSQSTSTRAQASATTGSKVTSCNQCDSRSCGTKQFRGYQRKETSSFCRRSQAYCPSTKSQMGEDSATTGEACSRQEDKTHCRSR